MSFDVLSLFPPAVRYWVDIARNAAANWSESDAFVYAAALAFFTIFSIAPVVIVAVLIAEIVLGQPAVEGRILEQLGDFVGEEAAEAVETAVTDWYFDQGGLLPTIAGLAAMLIGATTVFAYMQRSLDAIWDVVPRPSKSGLIAMFKTRLMALAVVLAIALIMLASLLLNVLLQAVITYAPEWIPVSDFSVMVTELAITFVVLSGVFAALFRVMPHVVLYWRDVVVGGAVTAVLFLIGRQLITLYLTQAAPASAYGAAASLVLLLLWVNYSSLILLYGAAFTRAHLEARGGIVVPDRSAVLVRRELLHEPPTSIHGGPDTVKAAERATRWRRRSRRA